MCNSLDSQTLPTTLGKRNNKSIKMLVFLRSTNPSVRVEFLWFGEKIFVHVYEVV
jgi:hypothetical protein